MKRRLFNLLAAVSLVLCLATVGLWVRSYWHRDELHRSGPTHSISIFLNRGAAQVERYQIPPIAVGWSYSRGPVVDELWWLDWRWGITRDWHFLGLGWQRVKGGSKGAPEDFSSYAPASLIRVPLWVPAAVLSMLPLITTLRMTRAVIRASRGHCRVCNYDLRATPERCPECGALANKPETVKT